MSNFRGSLNVLLEADYAFSARTTQNNCIRHPDQNISSALHCKNPVFQIMEAISTWTFGFWLLYANCKARAMFVSSRFPSLTPPFSTKSCHFYKNQRQVHDSSPPQASRHNCSRPSTPILSRPVWNCEIWFQNAIFETLKTLFYWKSRLRYVSQRFFRPKK